MKTLFLLASLVTLGLFTACSDDLDAGTNEQSAGAAGSSGSSAGNTSAGAAGSAGGAPLTGQGTAVGPLAAQDGHLEIFWTYSQNNNLPYAMGSGQSTSAQLSYSYPSPPPTETQLTSGSSRFAVGVFTLFPTGVDLPDGVVDVTETSTFYKNIYGISARYALLYRQGPMTSDELTWLNSFPDGQVSCGKCVKGDGAKDTYEPVECDEIQVETFSVDWGTVKDNDIFGQCDWT